MFVALPEGASRCREQGEKTIGLSHSEQIPPPVLHEQSSNMTDESLTQDAVRQIAAGIALIRGSSLLMFDAPSLQFCPANINSFETEASSVHSRFGRVMKWIWFSTGAEYLLKGALISTGDFVPLRGTEKLEIPREDEMDAWIDKVFTSAAKSSKTDYKTLSDMQLGLKHLCGRHQSESAQGKSLRAAFLLLGESVRNRDAHAYVPDVRIGHFHLLRLFAPAFNTLLRWANFDVVRKALDEV
jgi:hypothetical protein